MNTSGVVLVQLAPMAVLLKFPEFIFVIPQIVRVKTKVPFDELECFDISHVGH